MPSSRYVLADSYSRIMQQGSKRHLSAFFQHVMLPLQGRSKARKIHVLRRAMAPVVRCCGVVAACGGICSMLLPVQLLLE